MTVEAVPAIITQITLDVAECVDSAWAVAMSRLGSGLLPLYTFGQHPDLDRCVAHTGLMLSEQLPSADASRALGRSNGENWAPRIICPIRVRGEVFAVLAFGPKNDRDEYTARDRDLIASIAVHVSLMMSDERLAATIGMKIAQLHRTKLELDSARQVQDRLYPWRLPPIKGLDYYGECRPTGEVGGDFFDFVALDNSSLLVSIGDVSGKGVPAAIIMAGVLASLRALGVSNRGKISDLVRDLNRMVWEVSPDNFYATMFYAHIDGPRHELRYVNAGHDRVILLRDDLTRAVNLESTGTVLGLSTKAAYDQRTIPLEPGDVLVAVTDGITEAADSDGHILDEDAILQAVRDHPEGSSSDLAGYIIRAVDAFTGGALPADDRTIVVVRFLGAMMDALLEIPIKERAFAHVA